MMVIQNVLDAALVEANSMGAQAASDTFMRKTNGLGLVSGNSMFAHKPGNDLTESFDSTSSFGS